MSAPMKKLPFLPTTVVGSYPQPDWLVNRAMLTGRLPPRTRAKEIWRISEPMLEGAQDDATLLAIRDMEHAGIDIVTDGPQPSSASRVHGRHVSAQPGTGKLPPSSQGLSCSGLRFGHTMILFCLNIATPAPTRAAGQRRPGGRDQGHKRGVVQSRVTRGAW